MGLLIDTDLLVDVERGVAAPEVEALLGEEDCLISVITVSELLHGILRAAGPVRVRRRAVVENLLASVTALPITETVARIHAEIWADLAGRGRLIEPHDMWIAASALAHDLGVATANRAHFERVAGLRVVAVR
ncbi:MAG TPA: PIN domain-containing protein [Solirubrobacteraceae bacterium]|nr:PIN domain-containing protein [Solirubrobacteraceae bacterium]